MKEDLQDYINEYLEDIVEEHFEAWKEQYWRKSVEQVESMLYHYDFSGEIESAEEHLERELSEQEKADYEGEFIDVATRNFYN